MPRFARPVPSVRAASVPVSGRAAVGAPRVPRSWQRQDRLASALETVVAGVLIVAVAAVSGVLLAGCDSDGLGLGDYTGTTRVDGQAEAFDGEAVYTVVETARGPRFVLGLFKGDLYDSRADGYDFAAVRRDGGRPGVGGYSVTTEGAGSRAFTASYARVRDADDPDAAQGPVVRATEGVVTITRVDDLGFVSGTVHFSGDGVRVENPRQRVSGEVTATFEARYERPETLRRLGVDVGLDD